MNQDQDIIMNETEDIELELQNLYKFDNEKQLRLLKQEISHIVIHHLSPPEGWYDERYEYIDMYSNLDWSGLAKRFHNKDEYIHNTAICILHLIDELVEERSIRPTFHLYTYYNLIHCIYNIWKYYEQIFITDETDDEIAELIEGLKYLSKF